MTLLYLALAYMIGIALGRAAWDAGLLGCATPPWLWIAPVALLPLTPLLNRRAQGAHAQPQLRWPASAGFVPPRTLPSPGLITGVALCSLAGILRFAAQPLVPCWTPGDLAYYNLPANRAFDEAAPMVAVTGAISSYPLVADTRQRMEVVASSVEVDGVVRPVTGRLRLTTGIRERYRYGQPVRVTGRLVAPPEFEDFSYREYLARKGIHSLLYSPRIRVAHGPLQGSWLQRQLYSLRSRGESLINRLLPEPYAALANGMLLGIEAGIPDELYDRFNLTGTSHVIVISGSNVALVAGVILGVGMRTLGRRRAILPALAGIACYTLLVGGDAAVLRAGFMGGLFVVATGVNRRSTALVSLAAACWAMTLINPLTLWDVGFQLSSAATAGLILFTPGLTALFDRVWPAMPGAGAPGAAAGATSVAGVVSTAGALYAAQGTLRGLLQEGAIVTLAANVTTLPLVVYYFGRLSLVSLLTNLLITPVQPLIMLCGSAGVLAGVAGLLWPAQALLWAAWLSLAWTVWAVEWTASLPGAGLDIAGYGLASLTITYAAIALVRWRGRLGGIGRRLWDWLRRDLPRRVVGPAAAGGLFVATALVWSAALSQPDGRLYVYFLDIGQGDGILIQTPSGRQVLVDGGKSPQQLFGELGAALPFWDRTLDLLVLTHPDGDHMIAQIQAPARFTITQALDTAAGRANPDAAAWYAALDAAGVELQMQHAGGWIDLGDGVALWTVWPPPAGYQGDDADNENSLVLKLVYGDFSILLTGDAGLPSEAFWLREEAPLAATVLKVGHHGSDSSSSSPFVAAVDPAVAVIQVGADNDYGHPHPAVLATLAGRLVLRNDVHGRVHLASDGRHLWVRTEQGVPY